MWLPAITASPMPRRNGRDSPVSRASSTMVLPVSTTPSPGKASPGSTRTRSPTFKRRKVTRSHAPFLLNRSTLSGKRFISASSAPAVRSRMRHSNQRPESRKKTNMVKESKYTSFPNTPSGSKVPSELTIKVMIMPKATGKSILMRRWRTSFQALRKNGLQENTSTNTDNSHEPQRSK